MATTQAALTPSNSEEGKAYLLKRYDDRIAYYWRASTYNKRSYKTTRMLLIVLGAAVTLTSSLASASSVQHKLDVSTAVITPVLAAMLAIAGGVSQAFQWGAAWSDMVITATRLEKNRDRVAVTPADQLDLAKEVAQLDDTVLTETENFFQRLFGSGGPARPSQTNP
jgi:hypothetical protein